MAPKRKRNVTQGASSSKSKSGVPVVNTHKFVSAAAKDRYTSHILKKSLVVERGFDRPGPTIEAQAVSRQWTHFIQSPGPSYVLLVREFYANALEHQDKQVHVRGRTISFDRTAINRFYQVPDVAEDFYSTHGDELDPTAILTYLTDNRVAWKTKGEKAISFPSSGMRKEIKAWHLFICATFLPTGNTYEVSRERATLNYAIGNQLSIDVGRVIEGSILQYLKGRTTGGLPHPALITGLCLAAGVPLSETEEMIHPQVPLTHITIESLGVRIEPQAEQTASQGAASTTDTQALRQDLAQLQQDVDQGRQERLEQEDRLGERLLLIIRRQDELAARQEQSFKYMAKIGKKLGVPPAPALPPFLPASHYFPPDDE